VAVSLPAPQYDHETASDKFVPPRDSLERSIAKIWHEVLELEQIGVHDNFFDVGGHSLKAMQVVSRLRKIFRSEIVLRDMFDFPTIAELADVVRNLETRAD
jgi:acyl carrier protein